MLSVSQYQRNLKHYYGYYTGVVDGKKGSKTTKAIKRFQSGHGLAPDGVYGRNTNNKLVSRVKTLQGIVGVSQDGVIGDKTISAIKRKQKSWGLTQDGIAGKKFWAKVNQKSTTPGASGGSSVHFAKSEFKCKCGGKYCNGYPAGTTNAKLLAILEKIRAHYGRPVTIRSGQRCNRHNANIGGAKNSAHKKGKAADIYIKGICDTASGRKQVVKLAYSYGAKYAYANTRQMGTSVHINV